MIARPRSFRGNEIALTDRNDNANFLGCGRSRTTRTAALQIHRPVDKISTAIEVNFGSERESTRLTTEQCRGQLSYEGER